jgi:hypothetical protein
MGQVEVKHSSETSVLIFDVLHGVICQKIRLFITTAVRTGNPVKKHGQMIE